MVCRSRSTGCGICAPLSDSQPVLCDAVLKPGYDVSGDHAFSDTSADKHILFDYLKVIFFMGLIRDL